MLADAPRSATVTDHERPAAVLIAGGGVAALELLLGLRVLAGGRVAIMLLTPEPTLTPRAMTVAEPFERGAAQSHDWARIADEQGAELVLDRLVAVDTAARIVFTHDGRRLPYDVLVIATGARRVAPFAGALTFGAGDHAAASLRQIVAAALVREPSCIAFALPSPSVWPLPLYELALQTAQELRGHGATTAVRIVTPERHALELFGPAARDAVVPMLDALGIELITSAQPLRVVARGLRLESGELIFADDVVTLGEIEARPIAGLPTDCAGFIPVDLHGRVTGEPAVYAAGEATSFPLRQGGLATQQADAVVEAIASACGAPCVAAPFAPVLRGRMLTSGAPLYLQSRVSGQSIASTRALWSPPEKIAGRYLAPYLATARPSRLAAAPLAERVPALPGPDAVDDDAVRLAFAIASAEVRCGNSARALAALEAAHALDATAALAEPFAQR